MEYQWKMRRHPWVAGAIALVIAWSAGTVAAAPAAAAAAAPAPPPVRVRVITGGLTIPWDIAFMSPTRYLITERSGALRVGSTSGGASRVVSADFSDLFVVAESGLLGLALHPQFATNRLFYTCQSHAPAMDNRVVRWRLSVDGSAAVRVGAPVLTGIPLGPIHNGCRLLFGPDAKLWVTTGDAGVGTSPQDLESLGGKVLRINADGSAPADNPWAASPGDARFVWNIGHRNVQGLARRPGTSQLWTSEHGPDRDDEVNLVRKGRNYGWDPIFGDGSPGYNQRVPMTDLVKFPDAVRAAWTSGIPTIATAGISFVTGARWGSYDGALLVAQLKGAGVMVLTLSPAGAVTSRREFPALNDRFGRLRTVRQGPDGALYVLTANGAGTDTILRVAPTG